MQNQKNDTLPVKIGDIIKVSVFQHSVFVYNDKPYLISDFLQVLLQHNGTLVRPSDYDYINWNNLPDLADWERVIISKPVEEYGCKIKKVNNTSDIYGVTVPKRVEDYNNKTYAYRYYNTDGTLSNDIRIFIEGEWLSCDTTEVFSLKRDTRIVNTIQKILKLKNLSNDDKIKEIKHVLKNRQ